VWKYFTVRDDDDDDDDDDDPSRSFCTLQQVQSNILCGTGHPNSFNSIQLISEVISNYIIYNYIIYN